MSQLPEKSVSEIKLLFDKVVSSDYPAGLAVAITNKDGDDILTYATGKIGASTGEPMTKDSLFWGASTSKIITAIAVLTLVEAGKLSLDDPQQLYKICPELKDLPVVSKLEDGSLKLTERKKDITLRRLLTHTSGMIYPDPENDPGLFSKFFALDILSAVTERDTLLPLAFEPGTQWRYGPGVDWCGFALERVTGMKLGDYIKKFVTGPCGIKDDLTFELNEEQKSRVAKLNWRDKATGSLIEMEKHFYPLPFVQKEGESLLHAGGGGTFSKPSDYIKVLAMILNDGVSPNTGKRVLKKETVDLMFINQIPQWPDYMQIDSKNNGVEDIYPNTGPQGFGISWFLTLTPADFKRGVGTGHWSGISNIFYWCDRAKGVAGIVYGQVLPFNDEAVVKTWRATEELVYDNLITP